ncbi:MAG: exodeoxyribonuclease VII large subunit [Gammaproteobacteria bacterium]|nr:exodeoxyribonuclease VII large subunit [Gammaproteobacteria bacterium]MBV9698397.1 exodeoxyribonuclease VII large subunit [Gammaproteobacteria bacterium]
MSSAPEKQAPNRDVYSVSRLTREVRVLLERGLGVVWVEGELSNFSQPASGHWYFSLKDRDAQLRCAMYRNKNLLVGFTPRPGAQLLVRGRLTLYEARGEYQLSVEHMEEAGLGALRREFEQLKARLAAEGLFAGERKRPLPRFPRRVGLITSPTGAALHDMLHILARRFPAAGVLIYPAPVQGAAAAPALVRALELAGARAECEVLILARGGGSLEDLWAFNNERLARTIRACPLPVISGVGHEVDFTIADFVADVRAPTPSAAAELVVPDGDACRAALAHTQQRLAAGLRRELRALRNRSDAARGRLLRSHPGVRLNLQMQRIDEYALRLGRALRARWREDRRRVAEVCERLERCSPARRLSETRARHQELAGQLRHRMQQLVSGAATRQERLAGRLAGLMQARLARAAHRFALAQRALHTVSPLATLTRGFAIVTRADGTLVRKASAVPAGEEIRARLQEGTLRARVLGTDEEP